MSHFSMDNPWYLGGRYFLDPLLWPAVVITFTLVFRKEIRAFITRLSKATFPFGSVETTAPQEQPPQSETIRDTTKAVAESAAPAAKPTQTGAQSAANSVSNPPRPNVTPDGQLKWPSADLPPEQQLDAVANERNIWLGVAALGSIYLNIFQSQFMALRALKPAPGSLKQSQLVGFYNNARQRSYALPFETWLQYLINSALVARTPTSPTDPDPVVSITEAGSVFLDFCNAWNLAPERLPY